MLLDHKNGVICQKFSDEMLESRNLIYIQSDGRHFDLCGFGFEYCETWKIRNNVLCSLTDQWKPHEKIPILSSDLGGRFTDQYTDAIYIIAQGGSLYPPWATTYTEKAWATAD